MLNISLSRFLEHVKVLHDVSMKRIASWRVADFSLGASEALSLVALSCTCLDSDKRVARKRRGRAWRAAGLCLGASQATSYLVFSSFLINHHAFSEDVFRSRDPSWHVATMRWRNWCVDILGVPWKAFSRPIRSQCFSLALLCRWQ